MAAQLELFAGALAAKCPFHGPANVCNHCPEKFSTDGWGFVHIRLCKGRVPLKTCERCGMLVTREHWNVRAWCCIECAALLE